MEEQRIIESQQYLTFKLDEEVFALDICKVREVLEFTTITKVPQTPEMMIGVINLRGSVVPVIDFRRKFGMEESEKTVNTCIIITEITIDDEATLIGALVDSVNEVMDLNLEDIEPPPKIGTRISTDFIRGMGKRSGQFVMILDIEMVFSSDEITIVQSMAEAEDEAVCRL